MARPSSRRWSLIHLILGAVAAVAFALAPQAALAQHGGGGHFGGAGGGHFGGSSGGSRTSSAPAPPATPHPSGGAPTASARPPSSAPAPISNHGGFANGAQTNPPNAAPAGGAEPPNGEHAGVIINNPDSNAAPHMTIGFPPESPAGPAGAQDAGHVSPQPSGAAHPGVLSFSGEGHSIWQNSPQSAAAPRANGTSGRPSAALPQSPRIVKPWRPRGPGFGGFGFYGPGFFFNPFFFGFGFNNCDPLSWNWNFGFGCNGFGYWDGYSGYNGYYPPPDLYLDEGTSGPSGEVDNSSYAPQISADQSNPPAPVESGQPDQTPAVTLYLNDGTSFAVTDYWVADYKLHYVTEAGRENVLDLDQIDVQRTVDENASRGVSFTLKPAPGSAPTSPAAQPAPDSSAPEQ